MNKIILILPYFGKLPNTFDFFLQSCKNNPSIDWLIFTDCDIEEYSNIKVIKQSWNDFKKFVQTKFDFPIALNSPYKLCDFRPAYGYIFQEYIASYDYWGHCDCDLIWGDLSILNTIIERDYDRIGEYGHLILYKNRDDINHWFKDLKSERVPNTKTIYSNEKNFSFDEFSGMNLLVNEHKKKTYTTRLFDDIIFYKKNFFSRRLIQGKDTKWNKVYFLYTNRHLYRFVLRNKQWIKDESLYVHFQKRPLEIETTNLNEYIIIPNKIIDVNKYTPKDLSRLLSIYLFDIKYWKMFLVSKLK